MNPLTQVKNLQSLTEKEIKLGTANTEASFHHMYKDSAWIFVGGLPYGLNEGDVIAVFSQYGTIVNINLVRDRTTGKSKGFCFICYEDQRSTNLAVDNLNGIKLLMRTIKVDHVEAYRAPKINKDDDKLVKKLKEDGYSSQLLSLQSSNEKDGEDNVDESHIRRNEKTYSKDSHDTYVKRRQHHPNDDNSRNKSRESFSRRKSDREYSDDDHHHHNDHHDRLHRRYRHRDDYHSSGNRRDPKRHRHYRDDDYSNSHDRYYHRSNEETNHCRKRH
ncbi:hypothetical protein SNEBB_002998 [Seison nebaliae]|nr:hypothetical protein SNEBB_002998 [Seison nebaliae]